MHDEKKRILNFAYDKFIRFGFYKTSMDEIAADLQVSKKTIYKYFSNKENLVEESIDSMLLRSDRIVSEIVNGRKDVIEKFVALLEFYSNEVSVVSEKWIKDLQVHAPEFWKKIDEFRHKKIYTVAEKLLRQGRKEKYVAPYPPKLIMASFAASIREIVNPSFLIENKYSMKEAIHYVFDIQMNGILTDEGRIKYKNRKKHIKRNYF